MRDRLRLAAGAAAVAMLAAGCGSAARPPPPAPGVTRGVAFRVPAADPRPFGAADTVFGLDVLGAWCRRDPTDNIVLSPESLASGLGLTYLGARGATASAMGRVLHLPPVGPALLAGLHARSAALRGLDGPGVTVAGSDHVWADPSLTTERGYLNEVATGYGAGLWRVPLLAGTDRAVGQINASIDAATRGHIPHLLSPGEVSGSGWVLTDALYLDAAWAAPFQAGQTTSGPFTTAAGGHVSARFMHGNGFRVSTSDGWTAVSLPYRGGELSMIALLPAAGPGSGGCPAPAPATLTRMETALAKPARQAAIALPKVSLSSTASLRELLTALGMGIAFGGDADFTRLSRQACCIGAVVHAATLAVAEKGTVASAATGVGILPSAEPVQLARVVFDRPYLLLVTDNATGEPLFLARVADPAA